MTTEAIERQRQEIYEIAEAIAPTWERRRGFIEELSTPVRNWMLLELSPQAGDTVLELAAGVGDTGFDAAVAVGERGRLISTDFSPAMVEAARRRGSERGLENVKYRVIDAERIELEADSVDRVQCRFVAISLVQHGHLPPPEPPGPPAFSMADASRTTALLEGAGFSGVRTEEVPVRFDVPNVDEYLSVVADTAGPLGLALRGLSETDLEAVKADAERSLERFAARDGYELPGVALCAVAD